MQNGRTLSIVGLILVLAALVANHAFGRLEPAQPRLVPVETLPHVIGNWTGGQDQPIDPALRQVLPTARIVERTYTDGIGRQVNLILVSAGEYKDIHDPQICFPTQGFDMQDQREQTIDGQVVQTMTVSRNFDSYDVRYWLVGDKTGVMDGSIPLTKVLALRSLIQHASVQPLLVRLVTRHSPGSDRALEDLARQLAAPLHTLVGAKRS
ncbi:MAG TPA: exosortase-associated EpsI family protein [Chthonomonadaceae bacterium]|nr:exosortase-associated EpsI family protein [Chthonomonadaceae bacterium]